MKLNEISEKRAKLIRDARQINEAADKEGRDLTVEEDEQFSQLLAEADKLAEKYAKLEKLEAVESSLKESAGRVTRPEQPEETHKDIRRYSVVRAMRTWVEKGRLDGLEAEVSSEIARKTGKSPEGFYLPLNLPMERYNTLNLTTGAGAINTTVDYTNFIELLRNKMLVNSLGARVLSDLSGNIQIPKQTGTATAYWINADGSATITGSNAAVPSQVPLSPKTVGALTTYTRAFLRQTSMDVEQFCRNDLATVIALEMDRVVFNGSGSGAEPEGVLQNSDVVTVSLGAEGGAPTFPKMVDLETEVAVGNADVGSLHYVTTPQGRGKLKTTEIAETTGRFIWSESNLVNGYPAHYSNQLPSNLTKGSYGTNLSAMIFGNFADVLIGLWGGLDILVNPYSNDSAGSVRITMMQETDIAIRHAESFSKIVDMVTT